MIKKQFKMDLDNLTKNRGSELKKAGKWHLRKVFELLEKQPATGRKKLLYHLKMLKKVKKKVEFSSRSCLVSNRNVDEIFQKVTRRDSKNMHRTP